MNHEKRVWSQPWFWLLLGRVLFVSFVGLEAGQVLADTATAGKDLLEGSLGDMGATLNGKGRHLLYLIEGISALIAYRSTKNIYLLGSVLAVAIFINLLLKLTGF